VDQLLNKIFRNFFSCLLTYFLQNFVASILVQLFAFSGGAAFPFVSVFLSHCHGMYLLLETLNGQLVLRTYAMPEIFQKFLFAVNNFL